MFSRKRLLEFLKSNGYISHDNQVGYEAFGRKVFAYISGLKDISTRRQLESNLKALKQRVNEDYWPGSKVVEVRVSYFKAMHWDE